MVFLTKQLGKANTQKTWVWGNIHRRAGEAWILQPREERVSGRRSTHSLDRLLRSRNTSGDRQPILLLDRSLEGQKGRQSTAHSDDSPSDSVNEAVSDSCIQAAAFLSRLRHFKKSWPYGDPWRQRLSLSAWQRRTTQSEFNRKIQDGHQSQFKMAITQRFLEIFSWHLAYW